MINHYETLGIKRTSSIDEIKSAYRQLAVKYHPDKYMDNPLSPLAEEQMKKINEAYSVLKDSEKRYAYDQFLANPSSRSEHKYQDTDHTESRSEDEYQDPDHTDHESAGHSHPDPLCSCSEHLDIEARTSCTSCNCPLCMSCATQFVFPYCPDCMIAYNYNLLKELSRPLVWTAIWAIAGLLILGNIQGLYWEGLALGIVVYWSYKEILKMISVGVTHTGFGIATIFVIVLSFIFGLYIGVMKALIKLPYLVIKNMIALWRCRKTEKVIREMRSA